MKAVFIFWAGAHPTLTMPAAGASTAMWIGIRFTISKATPGQPPRPCPRPETVRSEERRVGRECRARWPVDGVETRVDERSGVRGPEGRGWERGLGEEER